MPPSLEHHLATIRADAARIRVAYDHDRGARIPWSDRWTVRSVARHVAAAHHGVTAIIYGRPTTDFGVFDHLDQPAKDDPAFPSWSAAGTEALSDALGTTDLDEPCWTSVPAGRGVRYWLTRMTNETLVHRWDAELGAGLDHEPFDPALAAGGVEEYVTLALPALRAVRRAPAGPSLRVSCTDAVRSWYVQLTPKGGCLVGDAAVPTDASLQGPAGGLLLALMGRLTLEEAGVELDGDAALLDGRDDLLPRA